MGSEMCIRDSRMIFESRPVREVLMKVTNAMFVGEVLQFQCREKFDLDEETYMEIIAGKTAAIMSACCQLGALAAGEPSRCETLGAFGLEFGMAFQIRDDLLDIIADQSKLGKALGSDLRDARMTLPLIHCAKNSSREDRRFLKSMFGLNGGSRVDIKRVREITRNAGSVSFCMEKARSLARKATSRLDEFDDSRYKTALADLCRFAVEREY